MYFARHPSDLWCVFLKENNMLNLDVWNVWIIPWHILTLLTKGNHAKKTSAGSWARRTCSESCKMWGLKSWEETSKRWYFSHHLFLQRYVNMINQSSVEKHIWIRNHEVCLLIAYLYGLHGLNWNNSEPDFLIRFAVWWPSDHSVLSSLNWWTRGSNRHKSRKSGKNSNMLSSGLEFESNEKSIDVW